MHPHSDYRALYEGAGYLERQDLGRLRLRGADRRTYLHGILTNDIQGLSPGESRYAALLTAQGRMITDMHVYELGDETLITLPVSLAPEIRERLDQYIFSEDVQVEDATHATSHFGVYGPTAGRVVSRISVAPLPSILRSTEVGVAGFEVVGLRAQATELEKVLADEGVVKLAPETLDAARVEAGIPKFLVDMTAETIPLEAGIEDRAINMSKGCYPGQEVIVRVLHRGGGRVAKKLVGLRVDDGRRVPPVGGRIRSGEREVGWVTSAAWSPRLETTVALGYVHRDFVAPGTPLFIGDARAEVAALPFQPSASADLAP